MTLNAQDSDNKNSDIADMTLDIKEKKNDDIMEMTFDSSKPDESLV